MGLSSESNWHGLEQQGMTDTQRLARVFVELADTLVDKFDVLDFLQVLTERSVELLTADAAGLMIADQRGTLQVVAYTTERTRVLELFELQTDEGPCVDCYATGIPVVNVMLDEASQRWPRFAAAATAAGFGATHAIPMRLRTNVIGSLNLFSERRIQLAGEDIAVGQAMADIATIGLLQERSVREKTLLSEQLQSALHGRVMIEQAKGVLGTRAGISMDDAFDLMRRYARTNRILLTAVAEQILDGTLDETTFRE